MSSNPKKTVTGVENRNHTKKVMNNASNNVFLTNEIIYDMFNKFDTWQALS